MLKFHQSQIDRLIETEINRFVHELNHMLGQDNSLNRFRSLRFHDERRLKIIIRSCVNKEIVSKTNISTIVLLNYSYAELIVEIPEMDYVLQEAQRPDIVLRTILDDDLEFSTDAVRGARMALERFLDGDPVAEPTP